MTDPTPERIAVLIPCYNEAPTIGKVIDDFRRELPDARVMVFDNNSTDASAEIARRHGAEVLPVLRQGKGHVVARMLELAPGELLVMVDGDDTYPAEHVHELLEPLRRRRADMTVGSRLQQFSQQAFRPLHVMGNRLVRKLINGIFGASLSDIMSGYRAFSAELARRVPVASTGFEVETEMTLQTLQQGYTIAEVPVPYRERPAGSFSKLNTFRDGSRVLWTIFNIFRTYKPMTFFGLLALAMALLAVLAALPGIVQYARTGQVLSWPLLSVGVGCAIISFVSLAVGVLLNSMNMRIRELTSLLRKIPPPGA